MTRKKRISMLLVGVAALLVQCKSASDVEPDDENELITTVQLEFTAQGSSIPQIFTFRDVDGDGGNPPTKSDTISLSSNTSYTLTVKLRDESKNPAEDIGVEVEQDAEEHLFVFTSVPATLLTYTYGDKDGRNLPIGLKGTAKTGASGTGTLRVQLRHQPPVSGKIVKDGTPGPGSDDVDLTFNLKVK